MIPGNGSGQLSVPPGFRFHPTDEELLYYYLKKKVSYEAIDLDVIREVDLNKLEPWDLKDRCRIGSGPQNEWYFFSHKDKKYPTGTRTNRATAAGFWKATGRDKAIYHGSSKQIGMRKTLVFYTGRAPHGQKTDWIMHEYRLNDDDSQLQQEDGWVVCRVFKKKNHGRGLQPELRQDDDYNNNPRANELMKPPPTNSTSAATLFPPKQPLMFPNNYMNDYNNNLHLPQLSSPDSITAAGGSTLFATMDNILRLTTTTQHLLGGSPAGEWGFLDKLLANYQNLEHLQDGSQNKIVGPNNYELVAAMGSSTTSAHQHHKFPFQYLGTESDLLKFPK